MDLNLVVEPMYAETHWCKQYLEGIRTEAERLSGNVQLRDPDYFSIPASDTTGQPMHRPLALLIGTSVSWMPQTQARLSQLGVHCLVLAYSAAMLAGSVSSVSMDYRQAVNMLAQYLGQHGHPRIAMFGINPDSATDMLKKTAFLNYARQSGGVDPEQDVFWNDGHLSETCRQFFALLDRYDAVICANNIAAIILKHYLAGQGIRIPDDLFMTSIGDTKLAQLTKPSMTTAQLDFFEVGRQAVQMLAILHKNPELSSLSATLNCKIHVGESTAWQPAGHYAELAGGDEALRTVNFYSDPDVIDVLHIEDLLSRCDDIDLNILKGIVSQLKYIDLAEDLHISENTVKYRIKKMLSITEQASREDLMNLLLRYFNW